jgi:hypothetical protein
MALYTLKREYWPREAGWLVPGTPPAGNCTQLQFAIVLRALKDVGIVEVPLGSNRGTRIDAMAKRAGSPLGSWWCAIWAGIVWADAGASVPRNFPGTDYWLDENLRPDPVIGAAILYGLRKKGPIRTDMDAHHIGIVVRLDPLMLTIEGNRGYAGTTNNGVAVDIGPVSRKDILGYVHPQQAA